VLNDVTEPGSGFDANTNRVTLIRRDGSSEPLPLMGKAELARRVWSEVLALAVARGPAGAS